MSFPRYSEYKDSGVPWFGEIPSHWQVRPFKWFIVRNDGGVWGGEPTGIDDTLVLRSTEQTVDGHWKIDDPAYRQIDTSDKEKYTLDVGDLLVTKSSGSSFHIGKTSLVTEDVANLKCCYSNFTQRIRLSSLFHPKLAWHFLNNSIARLQFDILSNSTTGLANLNGTMIGQIFAPEIPLLEQSQLVHFLDHETAKIDALVSEQERLIELLKEKRQSVILHAVTKGLNSDVKMKDSGVEWLGEVPGHWQVIPLKYAVSMKSGEQITSEEIDEIGDFPVYGGNGLRGYTNTYTHDGNFCLIGRQGALCGNINYADGKFYASEHAIVVKEVKEANVFYLGELLRSMNLGQYSTAAAQPGLSVDVIGNIRIPLPSKGEQDSIADYLRLEISNLNALIEYASNLIRLLQERRSFLISAAVTGKIDVRNFATGMEAV